MCGNPRKLIRLANFAAQVSARLSQPGRPPGTGRPRRSPPWRLPECQPRAARLPGLSAFTAAFSPAFAPREPGSTPCVNQPAANGQARWRRARPRRSPRPRPRRRSRRWLASNPHFASPSARSQVRSSERPTGAFSASASPRSSTSNAPSDRRISRGSRGTSAPQLGPLPVHQPVPDLGPVVAAGADVLLAERGARSAPRPPGRCRRSAPSPTAAPRIHPAARPIASPVERQVVGHGR